MQLDASNLCAIMLLACCASLTSGQQAPISGQQTPAPPPGSQQDHQHFPHHAPWDSPVASSRDISIGGAKIRIDFGPGSFDLSPEQIVQWIRNAATAVTVYYGRFPVASDRILVLPAPDRHGVLRGTTWGDVDGFPAFTRMTIGQHTTEQELTDDWTMTHELVHTAFPTLSDEHHWMEEGLATYVEPIARVQAGFLTPEKIWGDMFRDMPKGEPGPSDKGLDRTQTWAATYWGGALFCVEADVTIRERTGNRKGLQDALRAVVASGGTIDKNWELTRALEIGDRATGSTVLTDLYGKMSQNPTHIDLDQLWTQLGVHSDQGSIVFDNHAPLAKVRLKITSPHQ